jgi:DNA-binding transcriptional MocR family regulator
MSIAAIRYALTVPKLNASERLLFILLADRADKDGECFPSQSWMSKRAGLSISTVVRSLKGLEAKGHLTRKKRSNAAGRTSDLIVLRVPTQNVKMTRTPPSNRSTIPSSPYGVDKKGKEGGFRDGATGEVIAFPQGGARGQHNSPAGKQSSNLADLHDIQSYLEVPLS